MSIPADWVTQVRADGEFVRWVARETVHEQQLIHRSINVFVFHPDGRLLIQKRAAIKRTFANFWDLSCSGHVDYSDHPNGDPNATKEAYFSAATRELEEELGISTKLEEVGEFAPFAGVNIERTMFYRTVSAGPFVLQESEVSQVKWVTREQIVRELPRTPLLNHTLSTVLMDIF